MAISSVSRIYDAPDPILETDLELMAKVNTYQQAKYDQGAAALQNEINNWAMLADVAKPQDRAYINQKLNNLVSGIQNLGGVNLADANNVNSLKSMGYNLYGDNAIMNAVVTTKKLRGFMSDAQTKLSGKNAKDYDSVYYNYQLNKWNNWLQDGEVGTTYDGPMQLGAGSFENYQTKINDAINKLTPDSEEAPQGPDALNYLQVGSKFIKKERINQLIDGMTTSQDRDVISAHAWNTLGTTPDAQLVKYVNDGYNSKIDTLKSDYNTLKHNLAQTQDFSQKQVYKAQMDQINTAIKTINDQKGSLAREAQAGPINEGQRDLLRSSLYFDSYKDGISTARAFQQNKTELKYNQAKAFQLREARQAYEFGQSMKQRVTEFNLAVRKQDFEEQKTLAEIGMTADLMGLTALGLKGPAGAAPLTYVENMGKDDATVMNDKTVTNANANYVASSNAFYNDAYNTLGALPEYQQYITRQANGVFTPKDDSAKKVLDQAVLNKILSFDAIAKMPLIEREKYVKELSSDDSNMLANYRNLKEAQLYKQQVADLEDKAFRSVGLESPGNKSIAINYVGVNQNDQMIFRRGPGSISIRELKQMVDSNDPRLQQMINDGAFFSSQPLKDARQATAFTSPEEQAKNLIKDYYDRADKGWKEVSKNYTPFGRNVTLPKDKGGKTNQPIQQFFADKVRQQSKSAGEGGVASNVNEADVDLNRVWVKYDASNPDSKLRYMAEVKYKKGTAKAGDLLYKVDLTEEVLNNPTSYVAKIYPKDNANIIYGLMMDKDGMTPLDESDNYTSALETYSNPALSHKFQIVTKQNPNSTTLDKTFRVYMLVPKRVADPFNSTVTYTKVPVRNTWGNLSYDFPSNFDAVVDYMNQKFSTTQKAQEFYQINGIPLDK